MDDALIAVTKVGMLAFVVAGMLSMGLRLTVRSIAAPLRDVRLVVGLVLANFVVVPGLVVLLTKVLPMDDATGSALVLLGCCAGAPFLPTLAKLSRSDPALAVGSMVLLMVLTIVYAPLVVPAVIEGATVSAGDIARSLVVLMLVPLVIGLLVRARYPEVADLWDDGVGKLSTLGLGIGLVAGLVVSWQDVLSSIGSWIFVGTLLLLVVGLVVGYLAATGRPGGDKQLVALGAAQRNISAALVIAVSLGDDVVVRTLVAALIVPILLILLAAELGKRHEARAGA
ncbi:bile acid:sodium symporter family protein [Cellulomonas sp. PhB143]|uniref:bile acid:sodium symporter family protein n=1 Tax=Cellulomonas sp. PhB143 TaxID=2485186 RepID=UPI000FC22177|nr:bile acid:sodium symporter [Cellulomonas sp. PhB143]ROS78842.1 BASS family bile acid:Na+ symporter [Cellulomonas sp. PhB143]